MAKNGQQIDDLYIGLGLDINQLQLDFDTAGKTVSQTISRLNSENNRIKLRTDIDLSKLEGTGSALDKLRVKYEAINRQLDIQRQKQSVLQAAYAGAQKNYGADSGLTQRAGTNLLYQQRNVAAMEAEMRKLKIQMEAAGGAAQGFGSKMAAGLAAAHGSLGSLSSGFSLMSGKMAAVMAIATTGAGLFNITEGAMQSGESIYKLTKRLHTTTEEATALNRVFQFAGVDINSVVPLFARLDKQISTAGASGNATTQAMQRFGVSLTDQSGALLPLNEQLDRLAAGYKKAQEGGQEEAFTAEVLGARGAALIPVLEQYQDLMEINAHVKTTGLLDPEEAHRVYIEWSAMKVEAGQLTNALGAALLPLAEDMMPEITDGMNEFVSLIRDNKDEIRESVEGWGSAFKEIAEVVGKLGFEVGKTFSKSKFLFDNGHPIAGAVTEMLGPAFNPLVGDAIYGDEYKQYLQQQKEQQAEEAAAKKEEQEQQHKAMEEKRQAAAEQQKIQAQQKADAETLAQIEALNYHSSHNNLENQIHDIEEKAKKSIRAGKSEASAWKLAEAEKADAYRKFAEQVKQVEDEIYGMTHSSFDTKIHGIERREEAMRKQGISSDLISQYDAAARSKANETLQTTLESMNSIYKTSFENRIDQIDKQKKAWIDAGASEVDATKAAEYAKHKAAADVQQEFTEKLKSYTQSELQNRLDAIEKEKKAWIDKGISEVNATKLAEQEKADAIANTNRSVMTSQRDELNAYKFGGEEGLRNYIKRKDKYDSSITADDVSNFQAAQKSVIRDLYGGDSTPKIYEPTKQTADNTRGILEFLTGKSAETKTGSSNGGNEYIGGAHVYVAPGGSRDDGLAALRTALLWGNKQNDERIEQYTKLRNQPNTVSGYRGGVGASERSSVSVSVYIDNAVTEDSASMRALANHVAGKIIPAVENQIGGNRYGY